MTEIRFQADADLRQAIVPGAIRRRPNLDFQSANETGLEGIMTLQTAKWKIYEHFFPLYRESRWLFSMGWLKIFFTISSSSATIPLSLEVNFFS
ncbi:MULTISPECIES: hypothetical protein [Microcystis]|uniref:hypothetical protein n=1 Tax=Microcystis TaxID=1125 RepID=UPI0007769BDD|nr:MULTISPECIES: hypothetical protein [Microcystis]MCA2903275.1 hypothetical protein [Microcystis sp. M035S1]KXS90525.1 hypothetical protein OA58_14270 [Microcystis aeruginosa NIES-88]MCA2720785.1 hypothetical protein [Microcystis sp. M176S2]MCA2727942.1 hypothetical protein [Microcystis sp. M166S2]MCA2730366.1 hypothetical protein [Microcystis sp. M162S2]